MKSPEVGSCVPQALSELLELCIEMNVVNYI